MRTHKLFICTILVLAASVFGQTRSNSSRDGDNRKLPVDVIVEHFDLTDAIFPDGVSELSLKGIAGLHLGLEEIIRDRIQDDQRSQSPHFSLHLEGKSVREILNKLCEFDARYTWSEDMATINVYPRGIVADRSYLLNLWMDKIVVNDIPDPDQALTPLSKKFPEQQIGYAGPGLGLNSYAQLWTTGFEQLTVRQFINRLAEHMGSQTSWIWYGGKQERLFTFMIGGFRNAQVKE